MKPLAGHHRKQLERVARLNIRPFIAQGILGGRRGAGILRLRPNIYWKKDKGREAHRNKELFPWFWQADGVTGTRVNDVHLALEEKQRARIECQAATASRGRRAESDPALRECTLFDACRAGTSVTRIETKQQTRNR